MGMERRGSLSRCLGDEKILDKDYGRPGNAFDSCDYTKLKFRLQTHPRELADSLLDELTELECSLHGFTYNIYVVEIAGTLHYRIGIGSNMYLPGSNREALSKGCVSRASTKIEEALHVSDLKLQESMLVLDVVAAPGAWTEYLSQHTNSVLAVDPGKLCIGAQRSNVSHIKRGYYKCSSMKSRYERNGCGKSVTHLVNFPLDMWL